METNLAKLTENDADGNSNIYETLAIHQRHEEWYGRDAISYLQQWAGIFILQFKLQLDELVFSVETMPIHRLGRFRAGHNGMGLRGEITLNSRHLNNATERWDALGTLLHELLHAWQQAHGTPGKHHHNPEFREKAAQLGLIVDEKGLQGYLADSPFMELLKTHAVPVPATDIPIPTKRPRGDPKLKKWQCRCTNVRCAVADLHAQCLKCGQVFQMQMHTTETSDDPSTWLAI